MQCNVSVIVPVYNVPTKYLNRCFESIRNQIADQIEYIIVDDGSEKATADACDVFATQCKNVLVIHQDNLGLAGARNSGLAAARGEYIIFLDSDDWFLDEYVLDKFVAAVKSKKSDIVYCLHQTGVEMKRFDTPLKVNCELIFECVLEKKQFYGYEVGSAWAKAFKREFLLENNITYDVELRRTQDRLFMMKCLLCSPTVDFLKLEMMFFNCENNTSLSRKFDERNLKYLDIYYSKCRECIEEKILDTQKAKEFLDHIKLNVMIEQLLFVFGHPSNPKKFVERYNAYRSKIVLQREGVRYYKVSEQGFFRTVIVCMIRMKLYLASFLVVEFRRILRAK